MGGCMCHTRIPKLVNLWVGMFAKAPFCTTKLSKAGTLPLTILHLSETMSSLLGRTVGSLQRKTQRLKINGGGRQHTTWYGEIGRHISLGGALKPAPCSGRCKGS